jgi:hypothetical protein
MAALSRRRLLLALLSVVLSFSLASAFQSDELVLNDDDEFEDVGARPARGPGGFLPPPIRGRVVGRGWRVQRRSVHARARPRRRQGVCSSGVFLRPPQVHSARLAGMSISSLHRLFGCFADQLCLPAP